MKRTKVSIFKKALSTALVVIFTLSMAACGSQKGEIGDFAATRGFGEGAGKIFIDDEAIALAGEQTSTEAINAAVQQAVNLVNDQRANAGLSALAWSDGLASAAKVRAQEITTTFSHTRPDGSDWWTVNSNIQYGENLAKLYQTSDSVVTAWMNSPTHRANIMDAGFTTVGIAICQTGNGNWYWAQEFGY